MPNLAIDQRKRVLIVDQSDDSRSVFRTVLERRGLEIYEAREARSGLELIRQHRPEVVVLDLESESAEDIELRAAYKFELAQNDAEMVVLGNLRRTESPGQPHLVRKPYHYGPLIRKIEQLVGQSTGAQR